MARISLSDFLAQGPSLPSLRACKYCDEPDLIWDETAGGKAWLFNVVYVGSKSDLDAFETAEPEKFARYSERGLIREANVDDAGNTAFVIVAKFAGGAHICPKFGPGSENAKGDDGVLDDETVPLDAA